VCYALVAVGGYVADGYFFLLGLGEVVDWDVVVSCSCFAEEFDGGG